MKSKKKIVVLFVVLIIILIILGVTLALIITKKKKEDDLQHQITAKEEFMEEAAKKYFSDKICPQGMSTLYSKYDGDNDINILYKGLYTLVHYIQDEYPTIKNYDNSQLQEYYKSNSQKLRTTIGFLKFEEFEQFVNYLKSAGLTENDTYKLCKIDTESYEEDDDYLIFNISFSYEGKDNLIMLKTFFSKNNYINITKPKIKFSIVNQ